MKKFLLALFLIFCCASPAHAEDFSYDSFARLPVQHEGRIKPLDTFARSFLYTLGGHQSVDGLSAEAWLAEMLFDPSAALERPVFRIFKPDLLDLPARDKKYYSYAELSPALQAKTKVLEELSKLDEKDWNEDQKELMRLQDAAMLYTELLRSFSFILPLSVSAPPSLAKAWKLEANAPLTLEDFRGHERDLQNRIKAIIRKKGEDPAKYNDEERQTAMLGMSLQILEGAGANNVLFRILPGQWDNSKGEWFSPWAIANEGQASAQTAAYMDQWKAMADSYLRHDAGAWNAASEKALTLSKEFSPTCQLSFEMAYNTYAPLTLAMVFYLCGFLVYAGYQLKSATFLRRAAVGLIGLGAASHAAAILIRVLILLRPPVSTLYESILFVALVAVVISAIIEYLRKDGIGIICAALSGFLLLFIAEAFTGDDSLKMLTAVLNTNFWLGTHVIGITAGYGWCIIVSLLAHIWLYRRAFGHASDGLVQPIKILALISLLFTSIGTILGGIWADQSWGRFWGWDPKENGALLIVLWLIWILHGQISGHIKRDAAMAFYAALSIVVSLAWFGVNLLSVGLHSYGFISGIAAGLGAFIAAESAIIGYAYWRIRTQNHAS